MRGMPHARPPSIEVEEDADIDMVAVSLTSATDIMSGSLVSISGRNLDRAFRMQSWLTTVVSLLAVAHMNKGL